MAGLADIRQRAAHLLTATRLQTLLGVLDQGVLGIGNLAVALLVLRMATKEEYGLYGLSYMTVILLNGFSGALFGAQMTVSYYDRNLAERTNFAAAMVGSQLLLSAGLCLAAVLATFLLPDSVVSAPTRLLMLVTILACPPAMAHDCFRSYWFMLHRAQAALSLDLTLTLLWPALTFGLRMCGVPVHLAALAGYGLGAATTTAIALAWSRLPVLRGARRIGPTISATWRHGSWALGGVMVTALQNSAYIYLLGWLGTARAVADLNAARMLLAPMGLLILGANRTLLPRMVRLVADHRIADLRRDSARALGGLLATILTYGTVLIVFRDAIIRTLLNDDYRGIGPLVVLWTVILLIQAADANLSAVLQAGKRFRFLALVNLWTAIPVVACTAPMILLFGAAGSLITLAAGSLGLTVLLWRDSRRVMHGSPVPVAAVPS